MAADPSATATATAAVTEPTYTPAVQAQLVQLRADINAHIAAHGVAYTADFSSPLQHHSWRDIYQRNKHRTAIRPTPDPRAADPHYRPPCLAPTWPDYLLHRFLKARKYVVADATKQFVNWLAWRVEFGADDLRAQPACPFQDIREDIVPECVHGVDRLGRPLYVAVYAPIDPERLNTELSTEMMWILEVYRLEQFDALEQRLSQQRGQRITNISVLLDAADCTLAHRALVPWGKANSDVGQPFYPEFLGQLMIINSPSFMPVLWRLVSMWFDQQVRDKICLLGSDYAPEVQKRVGVEADLCRDYGGQCGKCGGECKPTLEKQRAKHAAERARQQQLAASYLGSTAHTAHTVHTEQLHIPAKRSHTIDIPLTPTQPAPTTVAVHWSIAVAAKDVAFTLWFVPSHKGGEPQRIGGEHRVSAGEQEVGLRRFVLEGERDGGVVQLRLSNEKSMWNGKDVTVQYGSHVEAEGEKQAS